MQLFPFSSSSLMSSGGDTSLHRRFLRRKPTLTPDQTTVVLVRVSGFSASESQGFTAAKEEGPSCLFVGPETASQETLEALYCQARDAYYSGQPLIVDDMFDRVELKLRRYGSKSVVKYPRCSIRRHSTYADAEGRKICRKVGISEHMDPDFAFGCTLCLVPIIYTISLAYQEPFSSDMPYDSQAAT
ncbi:uncharacterized protein LOC120145671 [Hibiscus syriacus]|uniref:uncharacterized protein LOC120145671 n=1 Tax=Hibiscus syriacus TaxID=106335 RepID=UPI001920EE55|nr:uncharacterized protein LOC120145671 [Hibiscus syriacus]